MEPFGRIGVKRHSHCNCVRLSTFWLALTTRYGCPPKDRVGRKQQASQRLGAPPRRQCWSRLAGSAAQCRSCPRPTSACASPGEFLWPSARHCSGGWLSGSSSSPLRSDDEPCLSLTKSTHSVQPVLTRKRAALGAATIHRSLSIGHIGHYPSANRHSRPIRNIMPL